jgi:hypothetical protein
MTEDEFEEVRKRCASVCQKLAEMEKTRAVFYERSQTDSEQAPEAQDLVFDYFARTAEQWAKAYETAVKEINKLELTVLRGND